jgi:transcriptional regulator with XRE-family HTH domain
MTQKIKFNASLGKNIKNLRLESGFGVTELAKHMQLLGCEAITRESLNKIEAGKQNIRLIELRAFKHSFGISYDDFFHFMEEDYNE